jgi:putative colanic acid biosynthesis acetyltransferase WcaF
MSELEKALVLASLKAKLSPWSFQEKVARALWLLISLPLFRLSWHNWYGWRRLVLRAFGARIGQRCTIRPTARIEIPWLLEMDDDSTLGDYTIVYNLGFVRIGKRTTISQYSHLCAGTHDFTKIARPLVRSEIHIGDDCWIAADAFVGPAVSVGDGTILGARSSLFSNTEPWSIYVGSPAVRLKERPLPLDLARDQ